MASRFDKARIEQALTLLEARLRRNGAPSQRLVVCGGSALIATGIVSRTTKDFDIVALTHDVSPEYKWLLTELFKQLDHEKLAARL